MKHDWRGTIVSCSKAFGPEGETTALFRGLEARKYADEYANWRGGKDALAQRDVEALAKSLREGCSRHCISGENFVDNQEAARFFLALVGPIATVEPTAWGYFRVIVLGQFHKEYRDRAKAEAVVKGLNDAFYARVGRLKPTEPALQPRAAPDKCPHCGSTDFDTFYLKARRQATGTIFDGAVRLDNVCVGCRKPR